MTFPFSVRGRSVIVWPANNLLLVLHLDDLFNRGERIKVFLSIQISTPLAIICSAFTERYSYYLMWFFFSTARYYVQSTSVLENHCRQNPFWKKTGANTSIMPRDTEWKCAHKGSWVEPDWEADLLLSLTQISLTTALHQVLGHLDGQEPWEELLFQ